MSARPDLVAALAARRQARAAALRSRRLVAFEPLPGPRLRRDGRILVSFAGNDYLGLASDPGPLAAARAALALRLGSGASPLVCGWSAEHEALAGELAAWLGYERALLFPSGYQCALAVIPALLGRDGLGLLDRLCHACLIDGVRLAGARLLRYRHADPAHAAALLRAHPGRGALLLTDGVFSMDGDLAPLPALAALASAEGALLLVDDAHGLGVLGPEGRGSVAALGLGPAQVPLLMGGFGKAFGAAGAFLAGPAALLGGLLEEARGLIYSTAPPPALAAALRVALGRLRAAEERRERLRALVARFRAGAAALGLPLLPSTTPIQPLAVGEEGRALRIAEALAERGFLVPAIRPPTVPPGTARLRISLSALHQEAEIDALLEALAAALAADPA